MTRDRPRFDYLVPGPSDFYVCSFIAGSTLSVRPTKPLFHSGLYSASWKRFHPALSVICFAASSRASLMYRSMFNHSSVEETFTHQVEFQLALALNDLIWVTNINSKFLCVGIFKILESEVKYTTSSCHGIFLEREMKIEI